MKCSYCGNTSGKRDTWGGCISCGGQDFITENDMIPNLLFGKVANGWMSVEEIRKEYMGTGGYFYRDDRYAPATCPPPKREESIKEVIRRAVGFV